MDSAEADAKRWNRKVVLQLNGIPQEDLTDTVLCKISRAPVRAAERHDYAILTDGGRDPGKGYAAILTDNSSFNNTKTPVILCDKQELQLLNDGDVIFIGEDGRIDILYERMSEHNSLLVTERCNCSCIMCPQFINNQEEDKTPLNLRLISLIDKQAQVVGITGGEPTLLGDGLIEIVAACKERLPNTKLMLLTNGIRLDDFDYVKKLMLVRHPDLTIDVPLYSDTDTEHNKVVGAKGFYRTINGLYNLARFNQRIGIRIVMHRLTYKRLPHLAEFLYHNFPFVFHIAFMQMETIHAARENADLLWIDPHDYNKQLEEAVLYLWRRGMNVSIYNAQLCVLPEILWRFARKSISTWKNVYLEECSECSVREICGGLFASSVDLHSAHLRPLKGSKNVLNDHSLC